MADLINEIVGQEAYQQLDKLSELLDRNATKLQQLTNTVINIDLKVNGSNGAASLVADTNALVSAQKKAQSTVDELTLAIAEYKKILDSTAKSQAQANALTSEEAKANAAASVELNERKRLLREEAQAQNALYQARKQQIEAQKEAIRLEKEEIREAKQMYQLQLDMERRLREHEAAQKRDAAESEKRLKAVDDLNNGYKQLVAQYNATVVAGKRLGVELGRTAPEYQKIREEAAKMRAEIDAIDADFGDHRRNVGNYRSAYNGLAASFNQITRELPALAINANTFFLSISNNLPIFFDELKRATDTVKAAKVEALALSKAAATQAETAALAAGATREQAKAAGILAGQQAAANAQQGKAITIGRQLFNAIFSWQTLLSTAVALLTVFGGKIVEAFTGGTSAAEKLRDALSKVAESTSKEVAELLRLQTALNDTNASRLDLQKNIDDARSKYPEYLSLLGQEYVSLEDINAAIEKQINLIQARAVQEAALEALTEAVKEQGEAELNLRNVLAGNLGFWSKTFSVIKALGSGFRDMTPAQYALIEAMSEAADAQKQVNEAREAAINPIKAQISQAIQYQDKLRGEIAELQKVVDKNTDLAGRYQDAIRAKEGLIATTEGLIRALQAEYIQTTQIQKRVLTTNELAALQAETRVLQAKKGGAEELRLQKELVYAKLRVAEEQLQNEYKISALSLEHNIEYQAKLVNLRAKAEDEIEQLENRKQSRRRKYDPTRAEIKANEDLNRAMADFYKQRLEADQAFQSTIFENETYTLKERLVAYRKFIQDEQDLYEIETGVQLTNLYARLAKIEEIKKTAEGKRTNAQKALLQDEQAINTQIETIELAREFNRWRRVDEGAKKERDIIKNATAEAVRQMKERLQEQENVIEEDRRTRTAALNKEYEDGLINYRTYNQRYKAIQSEAAKALHEMQVQFLQDEISNTESLIFASLGLSEEEREALSKYLKELREELSDLTQPKEIQTRKPVSLLYLLGFGNDPNMTEEQIVEQAKRDLAGIIKNLWGTLFDMIDSMRDDAYQKQYDRIEEEKRMLQERAENERLAVESELLSQEEKTRRLADINGRALADERRLDNERKALQREQAQREKDDAIFKIAMNGALAASQALTTIVSGNPASVGIAIASAALIAAQTAAAIAMAASRPIPQYFEGAGPGTPNPSHPGGLAIVGEEGTERVNLPSGKSFMTPNTATLMNLPAGTTVTPHDQVMTDPQFKAMAILANSPQPVTQADYIDAMVSALRGEFEDLREVIKNKPVLDISMENGQLRTALKRHNGIDKYIGRIKGTA